MGYKQLILKLPTDYEKEQLSDRIEKELGRKDFTFQIENKSLDARNKNNIHWLIKIAVTFPTLKEDNRQKKTLEIPFKKRNKKAIVVGSGPAGFFAAIVLQKAGFQTTILERGADVYTRKKKILHFEKTGEFSANSNYAFGEGGAGTFSDGKLTSRSKHINLEREFIHSEYIKAGAPPEIAYMAHPHLGTDNLIKITQKLRENFYSIGGEIQFDTQFLDFNTKKNLVVEAITSKGNINADIFFVAPGHSAFETHRMMIKNGVKYRTKNFALGFRAEHPQEIINKAQWGKIKLPGIKAAEYRLTHNSSNHQSVFTFCMCPGGMVVPATAYSGSNIVNGMSYYQRNGQFANAACVAAIHPDQILQKTSEPLEILDWLEKLEISFYNFSKSYNAPSCTIQDFLKQKSLTKPYSSSYPFALNSAPLWEMVPEIVSQSIKSALQVFPRKIKGYETGQLLGLESKTSSPIQVIREKNGLIHGFDNLYLIGEGSGYAGGIISSAADGVKAALNLIQNY